jgi:hypothetical protein
MTTTTTTDTTTMMMKTTMLHSPQTWRTTSATAVNPYKQQSTLQSVGGNDVKEETWQMGKQTMDNGY